MKEGLLSTKRIHVVTVGPIAEIGSLLVGGCRHPWEGALDGLALQKNQIQGWKKDSCSLQRE